MPNRTDAPHATKSIADALAGAVAAKAATSTGAVMASASMPMHGESALRGGDAALAIEASAIRTNIIHVFNETAQLEDRSGRARVRGLFVLFTKAPLETVKKALDLKDAGFAQGSTEYVALSNTRTVFRAWTENIAIDEDTTPVGGSWKARLTYARDELRRMAHERHVRKVLGDSFVDASLALGLDADPTETAERTQKIAAEKLAAEDQEKAERKAERETPQSRAYAYARTMVEDPDRGLAYAQEWERHFHAAVQLHAKALADKQQQANREQEAANRREEDKRHAA